MSSMRMLISSVGIMSLSVASAAALAGPSCTLFEHRDYGGAHKRLANGDDLLMINDPQPDVGTSNGVFNIRYDNSWNDVVSSFKVDPSCTLTLWQHVNKGGARFRSKISYRYVGSRWNDQASEAMCTCPGLPNF
jgi:hypothetical protein